MYTDDILLYKPISQPEDYSGLQADIDAIQDCISTNYLPHTNASISFAQERYTPIYLLQDSYWVA